MTNRIAILGGTGDLGSALARWLARVGHEIIIGSRDAAKAAAAAGISFGEFLEEVVESSLAARRG